MNMITLKKALLATTTLALVACNSNTGPTTGGPTTGGGGPTGPVLQNLTSPGATVDAFVDSLNYIDGANNYVELYEDEAYRSYEANQDEWFVIYDDKFGEYKAVSLQYVRAIVYVDYVKNTDSLASEFRAIEGDDIAYGDINGDYYGDDYEVVDYDSYTDSFWGRNSGFEYEDEAETTDVNLMAAEAEQLKFFKKASAVSYEFSVSLNKAMSIVTLGTKMESMKSSGELSAEDMNVIAQDLQKLTGVSAADLVSLDKDQIVEKAAAELGSTTAAIEQKLLPGLFGISL